MMVHFSKNGLLAAWSTLMCGATLALLAMDLNVRRQAGAPALQGDHAPMHDSPSPLDNLRHLEPGSVRQKSDDLKGMLNSMAEVRPCA